MDALTSQATEASRPRRRFGITPAVELGALALALGASIISYIVTTRSSAPDAMLSPGVAALLLLGNLLPLVGLLVLIARRIARHRAARSEVAGGGLLHVRLVAIFSLIAAVPIVLTVIAASVMFQSVNQFWVSQRSEQAFDSAMELVRESQKELISRWLGEAQVMANELAVNFVRYPIGTPIFDQYLELQTRYRNFGESVLFNYSADRGIETLGLFQPPAQSVFAERVTPQLLDLIARDNRAVIDRTPDTVWVVTEVPGHQGMFLYVGTTVNANFLNRQFLTATDVTKDYRALQDRARSLQLRFNAALFGVALLIVGLTVWIALTVADRLVRPVNQLVGAARRIAEGDLTVRVPNPRTTDEIGTLGNAFNRMTERLEGQTSALVAANAQVESRRALIEAVMSGVSAGVVSIDAARDVRLINQSAMSLLKQTDENPVGRPLREIAPELDALLDGDEGEAIVQLTTGGEARTLAVNVTSDEAGKVLTFDDITQQLLDQRRAAWSDVARRIAHEIKNPLTPIQLAAERLQRRYGKQVDPEGAGVFRQLTDTIVRQVGDLRRMVDEFSSFARMPKPLFRQESLLDIARQALFLHEVAHPNVTFTLVTPDPAPFLVCDRRQIGQALTNVVKNAVEAIDSREEDEATPDGEVVLTLAEAEDGHVMLTVADNGIGLPVERDRIVEPYMTTRSRGTGLGLAIVKKIVEEHFGTIAFSDRPGGGTLVTLSFDTNLLANLAHGTAPEPEESDEARPQELTRNGSPKI